MTRNLKQLGYHQHNHASYPRRNAGILSKAISPTVCRRKLHHQALGSGVAKCKGRWRHSQPVCAGMHGPSQLGEGGAVRTKRCFAFFGCGCARYGGPHDRRNPQRVLPHASPPALATPDDAIAFSSNELRGCDQPRANCYRVFHTRIYSTAHQPRSRVHVQREISSPKSGNGCGDILSALGCAMHRGRQWMVVSLELVVRSNAKLRGNDSVDRSRSLRLTTATTVTRIHIPHKENRGTIAVDKNAQVGDVQAVSSEPSYRTEGFL
jgi:hypothetical protein